MFHALFRLDANEGEGSAATYLFKMKIRLTPPSLVEQGHGLNLAIEDKKARKLLLAPVGSSFPHSLQNFFGKCFAMPPPLCLQPLDPIERSYFVTLLYYNYIHGPFWGQ
jgi:hypothetical protein